MPTEHPAPDPADVARDIPQSPFPARPYRDLCSTCNHAGTCGRRSSSDQPVFFCELFDAFVPTPAVAAATAVSERPASRRAEAEHKGLCMNCEDRQTCTMHRPEGGIWHCEEYR